MSKNPKQPTPPVTKLAATTLTDPKASEIAKKLAASVLSQTNTNKQTGGQLETIASQVLQSPKYSDDTKTLAGSVLAQANKER